MNWSLLRSRALWPCLAVAVLATVGALLPLGERPFAPAGRSFQLWSGWALALSFAVALAYVLRKYAHKRGYSPEFALRQPFEALDRAERRIRELRQRIVDRSLPDRAAVQAAADRILREEGVQRVNRAQVTAGAAGADPFLVRTVPAEPLGRMARWMHVHLYVGALFGLLLALHSRLSLDSFGAWGLGLLGALVWVSGAVGLVLWLQGPSRITARERDLSIEEAYALSESLTRKRREAVAALDPVARAQFERLALAGAQARDLPARTLSTLADSHPEEREAHADLLVLLLQEQRVVAEVRALSRVRASIMGWKLLHVPAALLLAGLALLHVLSVWKY
jgi:hypothetical protein